MKIYNNSTPDTNIENSSGVVCIGGFDGIHLAHQQLFKKTISISTCLLYTSPSPRDRG